MPLSACVIILGNENEKNDTPNYFVTNTMTSLRIWCCYQQALQLSIPIILLFVNIPLEFPWWWRLFRICEHCVMCGVSWWQWCCWWGIHECQENWKYWSPHVLASHQYRASLPVPWSPGHLWVTSSQSEASYQGNWPIRGHMMTTYCSRDSLINKLSDNLVSPHAQTRFSRKQ